MDLQTAIEHASNMAYEEDADMMVGQIGIDNWQVAHIEDIGRQAEMKEPIFLVHSDGVDQGHITDNQITDNWELIGDGSGN